MSEFDISHYPPIRAWMGRYPRKGADWSPEEDQAIIREYESGRYLTKEIAARHLREPVAIERRLGVLRNYRAWDEARKNRVARLMLDEGVFGGTPGGGKTWASERETARQTVSKIKEEFGVLWPRQGKSRLGEELRKFKIGDVLLHNGEWCYVQCVRADARTTYVDVAPLSDLPPEIAQALQFGTGS